MLKLFPFIKRYTPSILIAILLLFAQANIDLTLPDYLSRIVNIGLQQGGVDSAVPSALRATTFEHALLLLTLDEKSSLEDAYQRVEPSAADYANYLKKYPASKGEPFYVLKPLEQTQINALAPSMARALISVSFLEQVQADPAKATALGKGLALTSLRFRRVWICST